MYNIFAGFFAGLSVGVFCLGTCLPIFLPILLSQSRSTMKSFGCVLELSLGRLLGYFLFGLIIGWFGKIIESEFVHFFIGIVNIWIGIAIIIYSLGRIDKKICSFLPLSKIKWPLMIGFLTGVNVCPPFLGSLAHVFNLKDVLLSVIYFLMFFIGTSVYIVPAAFFGIFTKSRLMREIAKVSGVIIGIYFVVLNFVRLL